MTAEALGRRSDPPRKVATGSAIRSSQFSRRKAESNPDDLAPGDGTDAFVEALLAAGGVEAMLAGVGERLDTGAYHVAVQMNHCGRRSAAWRGV